MLLKGVLFLIWLNDQSIIIGYLSESRIPSPSSDENESDDIEPFLGLLAIEGASDGKMSISAVELDIPLGFIDYPSAKSSMLTLKADYLEEWSVILHVNNVIRSCHLFIPIFQYFRGILAVASNLSSELTLLSFDCENDDDKASLSVMELDPAVRLLDEGLFIIVNVTQCYARTVCGRNICVSLHKKN